MLYRNLSTSEKAFWVDEMVQHSGNHVLVSFIVPEKVDGLKVNEALQAIFDVLKKANKYIDETMPWALAKEGNTARLKTVIYNLLESIRVGAVLLSPFLPDTSEEIFKQLNTKNNGYDSIDNFDGIDPDIKLNDPSPLFVRIDKSVN